MAPALRLSPEEVCELFLRREALSSTVIRAGLAIPHIIAEGLDRLHIMLVRSRPGVVFTEAEQPVHIIFFLAVPLAERNFYLKALMAIAEIAQDEQFDERWAAASGVEALREVVLAAERRREPSSSPD